MIIDYEDLADLMKEPIAEPVLGGEEGEEDEEEVSAEEQVAANLSALEDALRERVPLYRSSVAFMTGGLAVTISLPVSPKLGGEEYVWVHRTGISSFPDDRDVTDSYSYCYAEAFEHACAAFGLDCLDEEEMAQYLADEEEADREERQDGDED